MVIAVGDTVPQGTFTYVPYTSELASGAACGMPVKLSTDDWKGKKVVLVAVPGAFTPTCHVSHMPPFVARASEFAAKGVDVLAFVAANDAFVMSAWGRVSGAEDKIIFLSDTYASFATSLGLSVDLTERGMGVRTGRWALVLDDLNVTYVGIDDKPGQLTGSGADAVLAKL
ncbi:Redoxin [Ramaria rubella]|nr:Redoxin [Ramaria rubella]